MTIVDDLMNNLVEIVTGRRPYEEDLPWGPLGSEVEQALVELTPGSLLPGSTVYTCMLNHRGGTESDLTVSRLAPGAQASPLAPAFEGKVAVRAETIDVTCSKDWQATGGQKVTEGYPGQLCNYLSCPLVVRTWR